MAASVFRTHRRGDRFQRDFIYRPWRRRAQYSTIERARLIPDFDKGSREQKYPADGRRRFQREGVDKDTIFAALEAALASATKERYGDEADVRVSIDQNTGDYESYRRWTVYEDDSEDFEFPSVRSS